MLRRTLLAAPLLLAACERKFEVRDESRLDAARLEREIPAIARRAEPGILGVAIVEPSDGGLYSFNGDRRFPMQSVFKAPLGAAVLDAADRGLLSLDERITVRDVDLSPPYSPLADAWPDVTTYSLRDLLVRAVQDSDNTAADLLLKRIGGPGALSAWLASKGVKDVRVDRYERELQPESAGLASFRAAWKGEAAYTAAMAAVPDALKREALASYLADPRDTATPLGMAGWLEQLVTGTLMSHASAAQLLRLMTETPRGVDRLRKATPPGATLAHKPGQSWTILGVCPASNDVGVFTLRDESRLIVTAFLTASPFDNAAREATLADVGRAAIAALR